MPDLWYEAQRKIDLLRGRAGSIEIGGDGGVFTRPVILPPYVNLHVHPGMYHTVPVDPQLAYGVIQAKGNNRISSDWNAVFMQPPNGTLIGPWMDGQAAQTPSYNIHIRGFRVRGNGVPNIQSATIGLGNCVGGSVRDCLLEGTSCMGILSGGAAGINVIGYGKDHVIENNTIIGGYPEDSDGIGLDGTSVQIAVVNTVGFRIAHNKCFRIGGGAAAIDLEPNGGRSRIEDGHIINNLIDTRRWHNLVPPNPQGQGDLEQYEGPWSNVGTGTIPQSAGILIQNNDGDTRNILVAGNILIGGWDLYAHTSLNAIDIVGHKCREIIIGHNICKNWHNEIMKLDGHHMIVGDNILQEKSSVNAAMNVSGRQCLIHHNMIDGYRSGGFITDYGYIEEVILDVPGYTGMNRIVDNLINGSTSGAGTKHRPRVILAPGRGSYAGFGEDNNCRDREKDPDVSYDYADYPNTDGLKP